MTGRKKSLWVLLLAACTGLILWLPTLGLNDLDDAASNEAIFTHGPLARIVFENKWKDQSPLYFVVLHFWQRMTGPHLFGIRFFNVLAVLGIMVMIYALACHICRRRAPAAAAAAFFVISPLAAWCVFVGRMYPLTVLLAAASALMMLKYLESGKSVTAAAFVLLATLGVYNHFFGLWVAGLLFLFWLCIALRRLEREARRGGAREAATRLLTPWLLASAAFETLALPQIVRAGILMVDAPKFSAGWSMPVNSLKFFQVIAKFNLTNESWPPELNSVEGALSAVLLASILVLCVRGLWKIHDRMRALVILITTVSAYAMSLVSSHLDLRDRYFIYMIPFVFTALGAGIFSEDARGAGRMAFLRTWVSRTVRAVLAMFIAVSFITMSYHKSQNRYPEWSRVMKTLDVIVPPRTICYMPTGYTTGVPRFAAFKQKLRGDLQLVKPELPTNRAQFMQEVKEGDNFAFLIHRGRSSDENIWRARTLTAMGYRLTVINGRDCVANLYSRVEPQVLLRKSSMKAKATAEEIASWASEKLKARPHAASGDRLKTALVARVSESGGITEPGFVTTQNGLFPAWRFGNDVWSTVEYSRIIAGGIERNMIWAHPMNKSTLVIAFPRVRMGHWLRVVHAIEDTAADFAQGTDVQVDVTAAGKVIAHFTSPNKKGWKTQVIDTAALKGTESDLAFLVTSASADVRHFGFDFRVMDAKPSPVRSNLWGFLQPSFTVWSQKLSELKVFRAKEGVHVAEGVYKTEGYSASDMHENRGPNGEGSMTLHWRLGELAWDAVGRTRQRSNGVSHDGVWAHPLDGTDLVIRTQVTGAYRLEGFMGFTDQAVEMSEKTKHTKPVHFRIFAGKNPIYDSYVPKIKGWKEFNVYLPPEISRKKTTIEIRVSSSDQKWSHFIFDVHEIR